MRPLFAQIGKRDDYRRQGRDEWGDLMPGYHGDWRDRISSALPDNVSLMIIGLCVLVSLLSLVAPGFVYDYLALNPALLAERPWTIITHMFVHAGFDHLFWNMLFLFFFGVELERRVGAGRFLTIYFVSGIAAALGQMAVSSGTLLGASGALFGVMGCLAIIAPEIKVLLFFVIPLKIQYAVVLFAALDFLGIVGPGPVDNIAHAAHLVGLVAGIAFGMAMRNQPRYHYV